ncbi:MAG TPA: tRNA 2-thiouridine(34) synthase MnmA [Gammaproteobacteria bacterium]|nr:tRNA 2-thiouridine(34) synthase MnmA [Gammaproteobacteria bacterium]
MKKQRIIVGMSGGVDSSVSAMLLCEQGYDVHGVFMDNWEDDDNYCTAAEDFQDARRVCDELGIPLHKVNFAAEYQDRVFAYFLSEYQAGRTPNPDVLCNSEIKFRAFLDYALRLGGDKMATGHYCRLGGEGEDARLLKGRDGNKDQSYFLHAVPQTALAKTLFPIGDLPKEQVRERAMAAGLITHDKKDSTGICFIGERKFRDFLAQYLPAQPGPMCTPEGQKVGEHQGLMYYTLGQRQGLGIGGVRNASDAPWYVVDKHLADNTLIVAQGEHPLLYSDALTAKQLHWIHTPPTPNEPLMAKTRYRQADQPCEITRLDADSCDVRFATSQRAVTPGQYVVFYRGEECLGGGVIAARRNLT